MADISKITPPGSQTTYNLKDATAREQSLKIAKEDTGRNYFNNTATTTTKNNITFTVNDDKSVTLTATQAASADTYFELGYYTGDGTTRKLMGSPSGSSTSKWWLFGGNGVDDVGSGVNITNSSTIYIIVKSGQTPNNVTFYPMITTQAWLDAGFTSYQPYSLPNTKITPELIELVDSGAKNLYNPSNTSTSASGLTGTITRNSDGSYTINGTTSGTVYYNMGSWIAPEDGYYILSGGSAAESSSQLIYDDHDWQTYESGDKKKLAYWTKGSTHNLYIRLGANITLSNITFYPMICTKAAWDVSQKFVPYRPTYEETVEQVAENKNNISSLKTMGQYTMSGTTNPDTGNTTFAGLFKLALEDLGLSTSTSHHYIVYVYTDTVSPTAELLIMYGTFQYNTSITHYAIQSSQIAYYVDNTQGTLAVSGGTAPVKATVRYLD